MPIIRWFFNHMVIVFVAVLVIFGAVYQEELEKELIDLGLLNASEEAEVVSATPAPTAPEAKPQQVATETASESTSSQMPTHLSVAPPVQETATPSAPATVSNQAQPSAPAMSQPSAPAMAQKYPPQGFQPQFAQAPQAMPSPQFQQRPASPAYVQPPALDEKVKEAWVAARLAFWQRDLAKAEKLYKKLVEDTGEADAAGELGNLYLTQRRPQEAADMYYQSAMLHLKGDNPMLAANVVGPLSQLAPEKARDVHQKIMALQAENTSNDKEVN